MPARTNKKELFHTREDTRATSLPQLLRQQRRTDSLAAVTKDKEIRRLHEERAPTNALLSRAELELDKALSRPLKPPLLLDGHTYKGVLGGALAVLAGFVFLHR